MARNTDLIALRNKALIAKYRQMCAVKRHGKPLYSQEYILAELSQRHFYITEQSILNIIRDEPEGGYDKELKLF